jgi:DNA-binding NarL/FixJ family response regulator
MMRVGIVDDHPVVRDGLAGALAQDAGVSVAWTAGSMAEARAALAAGNCDIVLVDVRLPDGSGLDLVAPRGPGAPAFLVLSSFDRPQYARAALERGAAGYVLKTAPLVEILAAMRTALRGGATFESRHLARIVAGDPLSAREREIVRLVAAGDSNDEIAARLGLSRKTIEGYLTRLYERFGVATRTELALRAEREGWLDVGGSA